MKASDCRESGIVVRFSTPAAVDFGVLRYEPFK